MSELAIRVENLSKRYVLGATRNRHEGLRHRIEDLARNPFGWLKRFSRSQPDTANEFWALKDVSFQVNRGDVIGIIGRNGAGKSTLLKVLSRITEPTAGKIRIKGRIASLLEVGTGFHPELTGRENIYLNGAILGMGRAEIKRKFDEIVAFAETEKFLDTPVKRYSSGMYVRLAFAVAAHLEPEILIVDEVLAVGDAQFQKKCLGKMSEVAQGGRTVLFVSHNIAAVLQLTNRVLLLDKGVPRYDGPTAEGVDRYLASVGEESETFFDVEKAPRKAGGTQAVRFVWLRYERSAPIFSSTEDFQFTVCVRAAEDVSKLRFSMTVFNADGTPLGSCFGAEREGIQKGRSMEFSMNLPDHRLAPGRYYCGIAVGKGNHRIGFTDFDIILDTLHFEIRPEEGDLGTVAAWHRNWGPIMLPELNYEPVSSKTLASTIPAP